MSKGTADAGRPSCRNLWQANFGWPALKHGVGEYLEQQGVPSAAGRTVQPGDHRAVRRRSRIRSAPTAWISGSRARRRPCSRAGRPRGARRSSAPPDPLSRHRSFPAPFRPPRRIRTTSERASSGYCAGRIVALAGSIVARRVEHDPPARPQFGRRQGERHGLVQGVHQHDEAVVEFLPAARGIVQLARVAAEDEAEAARLGEMPVLVALLPALRIEPDDVLDVGARESRLPRKKCGRRNTGCLRRSAVSIWTKSSRPESTWSHLIQAISLSWQ